MLGLCSHVMTSRLILANLSNILQLKQIIHKYLNPKLFVAHNGNSCKLQEHSLGTKVLLHSILPNTNSH